MQTTRTMQTVIGTQSKFTSLPICIIIVLPCNGISDIYITDITP